MEFAKISLRVNGDRAATATVHGMRSAARSWIADNGVELELAEACLAHVAGSAVVQCRPTSAVRCWPEGLCAPSSSPLPAPRGGGSLPRRTANHPDFWGGETDAAEGIQTDGHRDLTPSGRGICQNLSGGRFGHPSVQYDAQHFTFPLAPGSDLSRAKTTQ